MFSVDPTPHQHLRSRKSKKKTMIKMMKKKLPLKMCVMH